MPAIEDHKKIAILYDIIGTYYKQYGPSWLLNVRQNCDHMDLIAKRHSVNFGTIDTIRKSLFPANTVFTEIVNMSPQLPPEVPAPPAPAPEVPAPAPVPVAPVVPVAPAPAPVKAPAPAPAPVKAPAPAPAPVKAPAPAPVKAPAPAPAPVKAPAPAEIPIASLPVISTIVENVSTIVN